MSTDIKTIGAQKLKSIPKGQVVELKNLWEDQDVCVLFFRRWGCILCRLWAKEASQIAPVLQKNNIKLIGVGVEEAGSEEFIERKFFAGDLYHVEDIDSYQQLGFKWFNPISILASLFWKQTREGFAKTKGLDLGMDIRGNWGQVGGAVLVKKGGTLLTHFKQTGPGDHLSNLDILKHFKLEHEYNPETMANASRDDAQCSRPEVKA